MKFGRFVIRLTNGNCGQKGRWVYKGSLGMSLLRIYFRYIFFNELDDASCKICIFGSMQSRNNGKIFKLRVQMLDNHDNDAHLRWMIAK